MTTNIPLARERLEALANKLHYAQRYAEAAEIWDNILPLMTRTIKNKPQKRIARKITAQIVRDVLMIKRMHADITNVEIGNRLQINPGRVSEILTGQRTVENPNPSDLGPPEGMSDLPWRG